MKTAALSIPTIPAPRIVEKLPPKRAAVYCRISYDRDGGELGVNRQSDDGAELCQRRDFVHVGTFTDNDISATKGAPRPGYRELMAAVERGEIDVIVCWQLSRLWRNRKERVLAMETLQARGVSIVAVKGADLDLSNASGRLIANVLSEFDTMESEIKSERQIRQARQAAEAGKSSNGGNRPFGFSYEYDGLIDPATGQPRKRRISAVRINEPEAEIIRECARRVLAGESLRSVVVDLKARGVQSATGKTITPGALRLVLVSARVSGRREYIPMSTYKGKTRPATGEIVAAAAWPGIITVDESDRLRALLTDPSRLTRTGDARKALLSGILRCGKCGSPMVSRPRHGQPRYVCASGPERSGCGRLVTDRVRADERVRDLVVQLLADAPDFAARLGRPDSDGPDLIAQVRADEDRMTHLAADYAAGDITRAEWRTAREVIVARVESARKRMAASTGTTALAGFVGTREAMLAEWERMNDSQRRAVVVAVIDSIAVTHPTGAARFDAEGIQPAWRA